ncbi:MAG: DNA starvation/stationary phase protection protein Dps [Puniceicoccales bacterium]|nr:DNA starvation/stationary phase protection protein Dps [Puniceicoccales bacterium]
MNELVPTLNDVPAQARTKSVELLNQALADLSDLYSQAKQAHWNVRGKTFYSQHLLFDQVADSVEEFLDEIAERVVQLGGVAQGTVRQAAARSSLKEFPTDNWDDLAYVKALAERFAVCAKAARNSIDASDECGDKDTADLFTGVSKALDKSLWFLEAHLRG